MTTRPQHRSGTLPGAHRRPRPRPRFARAAQVASVAVLGGLLAAVALQAAPARPDPVAVPADAATTVPGAGGAA
ncbi:hypothetical protein, partial [Cellulomonas sp. IC4_254]|uniref:hypothetical protein n=1 Tax=Cellulomonas sp. IC4_254 TaxID=2714040 RepID=UPI00196A2ECC